MINRKQWSDIGLFLLKACLVCINTGIFAVCWYGYYREYLYLDFAGHGNEMVLGLFLMLDATFAGLYGGFALTTSRSAELAYSHAIALAMTGFVMYIVTWLLVRSRVPNPVPLLLSLAGGCVASSLWSSAAVRLTDRLVPPKRTLILYDHPKAFDSALGIVKKYGNRFRVIGTLAAEDIDEAAVEISRQKAEAVLLCGLNSSLRNDLTKYCIEHDVYAYIRPNIGDFLVSRATVFHMNNLPVFLCRRACPSAFYLLAKRLFDILLSSVGLLLTSPILLAAAVAIKAYDGGPVMFTQERMTLGRKVFRIHKLRSMKVDADKGGKGIVTLQNDDRITPIGKIIRMCRIDELLQLYDILVGNMTIVGPRPERLETIELYEKEMPEFALRLQVKAGLTGYAQVYGKANTSPYDKLQMDLMYIGQQGIVTDFKIILATIKILFVPESTEGFAQEMEHSSCEKEDRGIAAAEMPMR